MERWNHTASILAQTAEANRDPKQRSTPFDAEEFHPFTEGPIAEEGSPMDRIPDIPDSLLKEII
jgi:hypothetical protein